MTIENTCQILIPILAIIIYPLMQLITVRFVSEMTIWKSNKYSAISVFIILMALSIYWYIVTGVSTINFISLFVMNVFIYLFFVFCYSNFIQIGESSIRIRILHEVVAFEDGLSQDEIYQRYNAKELVDKKLERLIKDGIVCYSKEKYYPAKTDVLVVIRILGVIKLTLIRIINNETDLVV